MSTRFSKAAALFPLLALGVTLSMSSEHSTEPTESALASSWHPGIAAKYIGAAKCKSCHSSKESGDPYGAWSNAKHSNAFEVLKTAEAKAFAAERQIADPVTDDSCLECHVTGFGLPEDAFARGWKPELGVQCETCHGPGEDHMKERFKAAAASKDKGRQSVPEGEIVASVGVDTCVECHNPRSPSYKPFCYFEARAEIAHLDPRKDRTEEELAQYGKCPCGDPCPHADGCPDGTCNLKPEELEAMQG